MLNFLHGKDWEEFEEQFPTAMSFLRARSLSRERNYLEDNSRQERNKVYRSNRLKSLKELGIKRMPV